MYPLPIVDEIYMHPIVLSIVLTVLGRLEDEIGPWGRGTLGMMACP